jgi:hypothetical protein
MFEWKLIFFLGGMERGIAAFWRWRVNQHSSHLRLAWKRLGWAAALAIVTPFFVHRTALLLLLLLVPHISWTVEGPLVLVLIVRREISLWFLGVCCVFLWRLFEVIFLHSMDRASVLELENRKLSARLVMIKMWFTKQPVVFLLGVLTSCTLLFGTAIHLSDPQLFDMASGLFLAFQTIITGWPSDTFGALNSRLAETKGIQLSLSVVSAIVFGIFLTTVQGFLNPTTEERAAISMIRVRKSEMAVREACVRMMQAKARGLPQARKSLQEAVGKLKLCLQTEVEANQEAKLDEILSILRQTKR